MPCAFPPAVDDFAVRELAEIEMINKNVCTMNYMEEAVRRRNLLVPLLLNGSSGPSGLNS